ncbi:polysaccharide deacetylase family protein [Neobacillus ginsengisoli]|uniref:Peptidoglycan/xylan/chitin deacetylase (PgdA/CDA1 family) n=1 Tax=Neobacillus ginsengisoli TaxID=904295 RepID=A0ABT9XNI7_9BACI|nr:polysaccharide deacetylase family protein [Neobacillus ginsengisoli]MDQ0197108.1 peptidoglycan/xylan/chitin deacetylase (PgdA/CDA1 family) [Neobacillus ginsengisoli]
MNRRKITLISCFLLSMAALFACTPAQKKESANDLIVAQKKESANVGQVALKSWKEIDYRLPNVPHRQQVQSLSQQFPGVVIYKGNSHLKRVALTFDDGPDNYYTPRILDILRAKGVPGTFFMVGKQAKSFPDMVRRIVEEGNAIGNHSWDHPKLWTLTKEQVTQEIVSTENEIQRITGRRSKLFRPPYGRVNPAEVVLIHNLGYRIIDWSVDTLDWKGTPAPTILQSVNKEVSPGGIILEHCLAGRPGELNGTLQALPQIIDHLRAKGYKFVTVPTLIGQ